MPAPRCGPGTRPGPSQRPSVGQDVGPQARVDAGRREHVHPAAEEIFQILAKTHEIEERPIGFHVHKEIQVAVRACFSAGLRAENPDVSGSVFFSDTQARQ